MKELRYDLIRTYFKLNIKIVILLCITGIIFNVTTAFVPTLQGKLIDKLLVSKPILKFTLFYISLILFVQLNRFLKRLFRRKFSNKITLQMRTKAFSNLLLLDIDSFNFSNYGDIMNRQLADIADSSKAIETTLAETFDSGVLLISYFVFMAMKDFKLACICMIFPLSTILISVLLGPVIRKATREYKGVYSDTKRENIIVLQNEIYYRGFGINKNYYDKYEESLNKLEKKAIKNTCLRTSFEPLYLAVASLGYIFAFYYGAKYVIDGRWELGVFLAFLSSFTFARKKCGFVGRIINNIQNGFVSWKRCKDYMVSPIKQKQVSVEDDSGLFVNNLCFGYDDSFRLYDISFSAKPGEIIGVCGKIRSGKTTLAGALSGIYDYEGSIKLSGLELKDIKNDKIKSFIHYAPGKVEIFNDTVLYNITFGDEGDLDKAIKTAMLEDDINSFPGKINEMMSHSLLNISGGQQRRLQIARCVYNSPKLVILDDPFNAIGISMSIEILNNLRNNYKDTVFVIINNQIETLGLSDKILYLENNRAIFASLDDLKENKGFLELIGGEA